MNAKRLELCPCPPLPACVEEYFKYPEFEKDGKYPIPETRTIQLQPLRSHGKSRDAQWFFSMAEDDEVPMDLDPACQNLYMRLFDCRKEVADSEQKYPKEITTNCALRTIALTRPKTVLECMKLRGTFPRYSRYCPNATNGTTHNPTPPESSLPNTNPTPDTTLVFYMADTGLNEDEDEDEDEDIPEGTDKEIKAELAYPQEEDKKRKRDSDQGVQTGSEKEEVKNVG
ncbi:hypothetical protein CFE70_005295 [Pyrenophora teres f. teres 0-1]